MKNYDLVVIGGGSGGLSAAISAYDNGVKKFGVIPANYNKEDNIFENIHYPYDMKFRFYHKNQLKI